MGLILKIYHLLDFIEKNRKFGEELIKLEIFTNVR